MREKSITTNLGIVAGRDMGVKSIWPATQAHRISAYLAPSYLINEMVPTRTKDRLQVPKFFLIRSFDDKLPPFV